jgi:arylformamidase
MSAQGAAPCNLDGEYDLRAAFPDYIGYFADWRARSQQARQQLPCLLDVAYGAGTRERIDFFPTPAQPAPLLVYIHGGYWRSMDKSDFSFLAEPFVRCGVSLALINYDLFPGTTMTHVVTQVRRAYAWAVANAAGLGIASSRVHLAGWSAGAHLASMVLCAPSDASVASLLAISGVYDLMPILQTSANADLRLDVTEAQRNSPVRLAPMFPGCPVSLVWGAGETAAFRNQSSSLASVWRREGVQLATLEVPDVHHYAVMNCLGDESSPVFAEALRLLSP